MHEYSLMENLVESIEGELRRRGVVRPGAVKEVHLRVGALEIHSEESFRQAFEVIAAEKESVIQGARLTLEIARGDIECDCGHKAPCDVGDADGHDAYPVVECPKCGGVARVTGGRGIDPVNLVIDES